MALTLIRGASFPLLERRLLEDLGSRESASRAVPLWVVVPTAEVANHLRLRILTGSSGSVRAGIRVIPLNHFYKRLANLAEIAPGKRRGPLLDLLLHQLIHQYPALGIAQRVADIRSGSRFLMPTFSDLGDGGFGPEQTELLLELARQKELATVESEVLLLYCRWLELLEKAEVDWVPLQTQKLAAALEEFPAERLMAGLAGGAFQQPLVFFHGFYEFTDVNTQLLVALSRRLETRLYYPFSSSNGPKQGHPAFAFTLSILEDLRFRLGTALKETLDLEGDSAHGPSGFFLRHFPEGGSPSPPFFLSWQRASGARAEAISAALRIRRWLDEDSRLEPSSILVVAPDTAPYLAAMREVFRCFALPLRVLGAPAGPSPRQQALARVARIWQEEGATEWVLAHLRDLHPDDQQFKAFEVKVRERRIRGGESWQQALQGAGKKEAGACWSESERRCIEQIIGLAAGQRSPAGDEWTLPEALDLLKELRGFWLPDGAPLKPSLDALKTLSNQLPELSIPESLLQDWLLESDANGEPADRWNRPGVLFAPLMRSRGLTAQRLVVLGLSCGRLPFRIEEDPLLSDRSRRRLAAQAGMVGHRLPVKTRATDEQAMLFLLLNTSADVIHWVIPQSDPGGRRAAPTPWVERFLNQWRQNGDCPGRLPPLLRGPRLQALQALSADPGSGGLVPPSFKPLLGWQDHTAGAGGRSRKGLCLTKLPSSLSVTALESLARCPLRFYARFLARWRPLQPLLPYRQPSALERGRLLHQALQGLLAGYIEQGASLPAAARDLLRGGGEKLRSRVRQTVEEAFAARDFPHRLLMDAISESLIRTLYAYLEQASCEDPVYPLQLEEGCRRGFPGLEGVSVKGKIDRVEQGDFQACRVIDYKSGKLPARLDLEVGAGFRLQPALYPWLRRPQAEAEGAAEAAFGYVFLGDGPPRTLLLDVSPTAREMLQSLSGLLQQGCYFPASDEAWRRLGLHMLQPCRGCSLSSLCRRHAPGSAELFSRLFQEEGKARLQFLRDQLL